MAVLTAQQAAEQLGMSLGTIWRHIKSGKIHAIKVGRLWRIRQVDIDKLFQKEG